jgi:ABC-2 type transport system ATP-binding protein
MSDAAIVTQGLRRAFGPIKAVDGVDLAAPAGTVLGLLGPNGAGKTTIVRILTTLLTPDAGTAQVAGYDVVRDAEALRSVIGLAGQYAAVDENLTGRENLDLVGRLYHLGRNEARRRADEMLERFELTDAANRTVKTYSGGMRRRLDLGASLVGRPQVLFLDEPTTGLDPRSRFSLWDVIRELVSDGITLLLTTQYLEEADRLADHIAVIDGGRVIAEGTTDQLKSRVGGDLLALRVVDRARSGEVSLPVREVHQQIAAKRPHPRPITGRGTSLGGEGSLGRGPTGAPASLGPMLARQQPQRWQLKHLPGLDPDHHCTGQLGAAPLAAVRHVPNHLVGLGDLGQMGTGRAGLLARGAAALGLLGTALPGPRGLSKAIRGRRLGGVGGVLAQAALQLCHPGLQRGNRLSLRSVDRAQLGDDRGLDGEGGLQVHNVTGNRGLRATSGLRPACPWATPGALHRCRSRGQAARHIPGVNLQL